MNGRMGTHAASQDAAHRGARARDVRLVDAVLDDNRVARNGLSKGGNASHTLFAVDLARLINDEIADPRASASQSAEESLQVLRGAQLEIEYAMTLSVEPAVELRRVAHPDGRVCNAREIYVGHHLSPREDVVSALINQCGKPFDIARVAEQIPAVLQGGWLIWLAAIGIGAYPVVVVIVCRDLSKCGEKTDETNDY